jgi:hypothetical protein
LGIFRQDIRLSQQTSIFSGELPDRFGCIRQQRNRTLLIRVERRLQRGVVNAH